ncbi:hypothetical protein CRT23_23575 [Methylobacterium sp. V23]|nr:hypothetical protein CRT23_23575 [Methylobacterium sp. V23]
MSLAGAVRLSCVMGSRPASPCASAWVARLQVSRHAAAPTDGVAEDWAGRTDAVRPRVRGQDQRARVDLPDAATVQWPLPGAPA